MKIYFAFSIRGGKSDEGVIQTVFKTLKNMGHKITTEFNIDQKVREVYLSDEDIYRRDIEALKESDVILAEVSKPSLGVGYEICFGEKLGKKIFCIIKEGTNLSAMIRGNKNINLIYYTDTEDLKRKLLTIFNKF